MAKNFLKINLTDGDKQISSIFVSGIKGKKNSELLELLVSESKCFSVEQRVKKKGKILDRINVIIDRICKNFQISNVEDFEKNPMILFIVDELRKAELSFEILDEEKKVIIDCSLLLEEV